MKQFSEKIFDEIADDNTAYMIQELVKGTKWRSIVFEIMDRTIRWKESQNKGVK